MAKQQFLSFVTLYFFDFLAFFALVMVSHFSRFPRRVYRSIEPRMRKNKYYSSVWAAGHPPSPSSLYHLYIFFWSVLMVTLKMFAWFSTGCPLFITLIEVLLVYQKRPSQILLQWEGEGEKKIFVNLYVNIQIIFHSLGSICKLYMHSFLIIRELNWCAFSCSFVVSFGCLGSKTIVLGFESTYLIMTLNYFIEYV